MDVGEELHDRLREAVVPVAGDHVPRARHVRVPRVRRDGRNARASSSLTTSLMRPRTRSVGTDSAFAARSSRSHVMPSRRRFMNSGSQCQRQRPSSPRRRFFSRPFESFGRGRWCR
jgi:hypothetical protein